MPKGSEITARARKQAPAYAAIDLGTNNCRMLVACPAPGGLRVIDGYSRIVRLGEGLTASGELSDNAIGRTLDVLKTCADKIRGRGVKETRAVATEACRQAANGKEFLERVSRETGLTLEVISPAEEAELTLAGCAPLLGTGHSNVLMFDIGGGSTELMWVEATPNDPPRLLDTLSLPFGVVGLAEEFGKELLAPGVFDSIVERVDQALVPFEERHKIAGQIKSGHVHVLGTSGTVTTLGAIYLDLQKYDRSRVDGLSIRYESIHAITAKLATLDYKARRQYPCIGPGRADLMVMGCAILTAICRRWPAASLTAADRGIREGLLMSMMATDGALVP